MNPDRSEDYLSGSVIYSIFDAEPCSRLTQPYFGNSTPRLRPYRVIVNGVSDGLVRFDRNVSAVEENTSASYLQR